MSLSSIIIPYYKKIDYIEKTIRSILNQTYKNFEIIIVYDDHNSKELKTLKKIIKNNKKIKLFINKKNLGASYSRNLAIKKAKGDYIAFIDGEISAVRWRHWRIYPKQIIASSGNPSAHGVYATRAEGTGYPAIFNITRDPREEMNVVGTEAWVIGAYMKIIGAYQASIKEFPNPQGFTLTTFPK